MKKLISLLVLCTVALSAAAQSDAFSKFKEQQQSKFSDFKQQKQDEYDAFRKRLNDEYANFMRQPWKTYKTHDADKPKEEKSLPPVVFGNKNNEQGAKSKEQEQGAKNNDADGNANAPKPDVKPQQETLPPPNPNPVQIPVQPDVVVVPKPAPAPAPIAPIQPKEEIPTKKISISFYGALITVPFPTNVTLRLKAVNENALADAWQQMSKPDYDATVKYALNARKAKKFCDWAYLSVVRAITEKQYGKTNEAVLMQAYIMSQSGYRVRMAMENSRLHLLVASDFFIYNMPFFLLDDTRFYIVDGAKQEQMQICEAKFKGEKRLGMQIGQLPALGMEATPVRKLTSKKGVTATASVNKNLLDFFTSYPTSQVVNNYVTRWAAYANTPIEQSVKDQLYPPLQKAISGKSELEAVNILLNWVQTAFVYGYDDKVWGHDRAFFAQETLYYPYSDCEDRAILFSRLVRDLTGLDVVLLYYPRHLATAVHFNSDVKGDYVTYKNQRYIVSDPTYEGAPVGWTMPEVSNTQAKIIVLGK